MALYVSYALYDGRSTGSRQVSGPLQVRLEIDVVANLAVYLQAIPLALGYDAAT